MSAKDNTDLSQKTIKIDLKKINDPTKMDRNRVDEINRRYQSKDIVGSIKLFLSGKNNILLYIHYIVDGFKSLFRLVSAGTYE